MEQPANDMDASMAQHALKTEEALQRVAERVRVFPMHAASVIWSLEDRWNRSATARVDGQAKPDNAKQRRRANFSGPTSPEFLFHRSHDMPGGSGGQS